MLYLRIFPGHKFRIAVITVVGVTVAYTFAAVLMTVFACKPIEKAWRKTLPGVCVNSISIWYCKSEPTGGLICDSPSVCIRVFADGWE
jgi:hypothetical protein